MNSVVLQKKKSKCFGREKKIGYRRKKKFGGGGVDLGVIVVGLLSEVMVPFVVGDHDLSLFIVYNGIKIILGRQGSGRPEY